MKLAINSKKILSLLLICAMLFLACACNGASDSNDSTSTDSESATGESETKAPLLATDIPLSGDSSFRIVYADGNRSYALKIQDKISGLDKTYTVGCGKYEMVLDTEKAADGTPEIIVGKTNRPASEEAKKLITKEDTYAIYASATAIAVYSETSDGVEAGVKELLTKIKRKSDIVIYNNADGSYEKAFEVAIKGSTLIEALANTAKTKGLPVISVSVSNADGSLTSKTIMAGNPCQNCYSVTKVYCVTAIGMLYDEGKIQLTDTIGSIFAEEIAAYGIDESMWADVTIHDVMRHRAGFTEGGMLDIDSQDATKWGSQDYLELTLKAKLNKEKNDKGEFAYKYTDAAFYLISRVVSKISGENLDVFLAKRLFNKTNCREYAFAECPQGYPIGATGLYIRSEDVAKLGRIYLDGGKYGDEQIISKEWVDIVIENGYELGKSGAGYAKGGMRGQYLYINFTKNVAAAWHSYDPNDETGPMGETLHAFLK